MFKVFEEVDMSPVPIVTYDHETPFDVNTKRFGRSVWQESSFEVITFETQTWKQNLFIAVEKSSF